MTRSASTATHGISVALLRPFAELLGRLEVEPGAFLEVLGVDEAMTPETYIAADRVDACLAEIAGKRGDPAFALTLARTAAVRPLGLFGHMVWTSGTVRDAITRAARFYAMVTRRSTLALVEDGEIAWLSHQPAVSGAPRGRILTEFPLASFALRAREATANQLALRAVRFMHAGEATAAYREVFGVDVVFGAHRDELELPAAQLDLRLASADPITSAVLETQVARMAASPAGRSPFIDQVRREVGQLEGAVTLGADVMLAAGSSVKEVAFALGFSEPSAFSRAYKRWTGTSPQGK